jgi:hypothetical protein
MAAMPDQPQNRMDLVKSASGVEGVLGRFIGSFLDGCCWRR